MTSIALLGAVAVMVGALSVVYTRGVVARRLASTAEAAGPVAAHLVVASIFTATAAVAAAMMLMLFTAVEDSQPVWVTVGFPLGISLILIVSGVMARFFAGRLGEAIYTAFNGPARPEGNSSMYAAAAGRWWWICAVAAILPLTVLLTGLSS